MQTDKLDTVVLLSRVHSNLVKIFQKKLKAYGITLEQGVLFSCLSVRDGISPTELARMSFRDKPYTTRLINGLEAGGFIRRETNMNDGRSSLVFFTEKGVLLQGKILSVISDLDKWAIGAMSAEEVGQLRYLLNKLYAHIEKGRRG